MPAATATRVSQPLGVIRAPDTGSGDGTSGGSGFPLWMAGIGALGALFVLAGGMRMRSPR